MKLKTSKLIATLPHPILAIGVAAVLAALVYPAQAQTQQSADFSAHISPRAKAFLGERWNNASFSQGIAIVADKNETPTSRAAAMEVLHANRRKLTSDEMRTFLGEATRLAKDVSLDETNSAFAVSVMANLALTMKDQGQLSEAESKQEAGFLLATATDSKRYVRLRGSAITALGILKIAEASDSLREMLTNSASANVPEIARPACLSLMRIDGDHAIPDLTVVLKKTTDRRVFGTAAFALGQIKDPESVAALVANLGRFPNSGACGAALVDMDDVIYDTLKNSKSENLSAAIQATRYLWREGQREIYTPLLRNLLSTAPLAVRKAAADRLLESASCLDFESEKRELALVSAAIGNQSELQAYQERIQNRLSAGVISPNNSNVGLPPSAIK
jgi:HEAT repeat protein